MVQQASTSMLAAVMAVLATAQGAIAQTENQRRQYGALAGVHVAMDCREVPARDAIRALSRAIDTTIVVHARSEPDGRGLNGAAPVTISTPAAPARVILESILDQASEYEAVTWQLREHWIEVGTRRDLATRRAAERRVLDIDEYLIEPPYFPSDDRIPSAREFWNNPYHKAAITVPDDDDGRKEPDELALEMVRMFAETIDPGNWDHGQYDIGQFGDLPEVARRELRGRRIASMRLDRGRLIVSAPEFVHRAISGPPSPIPPPRLTASARTARGESASTEGIRIWPVPDIGPPQAATDEWSWAQRPREAPRAALAETTVKLELDRVTAREAFAALAAQLPFPLKPRWNDDRLGLGMNPHRIVELDTTMAATPITARDALETLLVQMGDTDDPGRWQVRLGYIEAGTRSRLSVPAAARTELHDVSDLILHVPRDPRDRKMREIDAVILVEKIVTTIEPDLWDWGQFEETIDDDLRPLVAEQVDATRAMDPGDPDDPDDAGRTNRPPRTRRVETQWVEPHRPAIIRYWRDYMIVHAPGFIHRQIGTAESERKTR